MNVISLNGNEQLKKTKSAKKTAGGGGEARPAGILLTAIRLLSVDTDITVLHV